MSKNNRAKAIDIGFYRRYNGASYDSFKAIHILAALGAFVVNKKLASNKLKLERPLAARTLCVNPRSSAAFLLFPGK